jgi:hypothetical protein
VPDGVWREMCLIGHWVAESITLRWAELSAELSSGEVRTSDVVERLLVRPDPSRDVQLARDAFAGMKGLRCAWTRVPLGPRRFEVDHLIPFSLWFSNELWNLVPTSREANREKADRLVARQTLMRSKDLVIGCWEVLREASPQRFDWEVQRSLSGSGGGAGWQEPAFSGLLENVETVAVQRGMERWHPDLPPA